MTSRAPFLLAVFLGAALLVSGCASADSAEPNANIVGFDDSSSISSGTTTSDVPTAPNDSTPLDGDRIATQAAAAGIATNFTEDDVLEAVTSFVDLRDRVLVGDEPVDSLILIAHDSVVAQVEAASVQNQANIAAFNGAARMSYSTFPDFVDVQAQGDQLIAISCTERWSERRSGTYQISFVDEAFILDIVDSDLIVAEVRTAHDGQPETGGLTCFSGILGERAVDGARAGIEALDQILLDPRTAVTTDFESLFDGVALDTFSTLAESVDTSRRRVTPVETRYTPLGLDPTSLDFLGVVSVCRHYPEGVYDEVVATGQRIQVNTDYEPGTSIEELVYVWIEPKRRVEGGVDLFADFTPNVSEGCW